MPLLRKVIGGVLNVVPDRLFAAVREEIKCKRSQCVKNSLRSCGKNVGVASNAIIMSPQCVSVGDNCMINEFVYILGGGNVTLGDGVWVADHAAIISVSHPTDVEFIGDHPQVEKPIVIEDNVWIGSHALILPGVTLGKSCIVEVGSVVTRDVPPYAIVVGTPARVLRQKKLP